MKHQKRFTPLQNHELSLLFLKYRKISKDSRAAAGFAVNDFCFYHPDFKPSQVNDRISEYIEPNFTGLTDEEFIQKFDELGIQKFCQEYELRKKGANLKYKRCKANLKKKEVKRIEDDAIIDKAIPLNTNQEIEVPIKLNTIEVACKSQQRTNFPSIYTLDSLISAPI